MSKEILLVVGTVSHKRGIEKDIIFEALENALASATRKKAGKDIDVRVSIDRTTGDYETFRRWQVLDDEVSDKLQPVFIHSRQLCFQHLSL